MRHPLLSFLLASALALCVIAPVQADEFVVSDIELRGLQRVSAGTVFSTLPVQIGDEVDEIALAEAIRTLFQSGLFTDIEVYRDDDVLILELQERPAISSIEIEGNKAIETDQLMKALENAGLQEGQVFKRATLERIELEIQRSYVAQGRYSSRVTGEVEELERNRVKLKLDINEGEVAAIRHINIIGNEAFTDDELIDLMELSAGGLWASITNADKYSRERLSGDLERIRSYYLDQGYIDFGFESTQVSISPDKKQVFISLSVNEGEQYRIRDVEIRGDLIVGEEELRKFVRIDEGDVFSRARLNQTSETLSRRLGREGYTFANVSAVPQAHDDKTASVTFMVEPGERTYVRRITFEGNTATHDEVLRQEMVQIEGAVASTDLIEASKVRLERLGFFEQVEVETRPVPGRDDQVDVNYAVTEQATGSLSASVGFSQSAGIILGLNISERNFFGTGRRVGFGVNSSESVKAANISYTNPYYTVDGVSRGFSLSAKETDYAEEDISSFVLDNYTARMNFGYPIDSITRLNFGVGYSRSNIDVNDVPAVEIEQFIEEEGKGFDAYLLNASWTRDSRNRGVLPTDGLMNAVSAEIAAPGSDLTYYRLTHRAEYLEPFNAAQTWGLRLRTELGYGDGYGSDSLMPFYEHFFSGGYGSVRGYEANSLGLNATRNPNDWRRERPFGGNVLTEASAELIFPTPFAGDNRSMRTSLFLDAGNVFDTARGFDPELGELRTSAGLSFQWITAIGPLAFSLAKPLNDKSGDDTQVFQFSLGQQF
ncbi:outer membrane protein assembly factor BamA [Hydrocarboniclastica marina]|uniref:Outer membrane protein assembly factor BamA n=1 Tax=Hydrocarboniclastica marina TaxID=2259620 RepID=A0A4P7XIS3_9ALTE|nr:outer membrane protein assembly factor BamA [Hydrocarboniclastica marina]QCF26434.1 outer membrane protein assembly factor BamA [Hydrocarboniclastica marina]